MIINLSRHAFTLGRPPHGSCDPQTIQVVLLGDGEGDDGDWDQRPIETHFQETVSHFVPSFLPPGEATFNVLPPAEHSSLVRSQDLLMWLRSRYNKSVKNRFYLTRCETVYPLLFFLFFSFFKGKEGKKGKKGKKREKKNKKKNARTCPPPPHSPLMKV